MDNPTSACTCNRLSVCALGLAVGLLSLIWVVVLGFLDWWFNIGSAWVTLLSNVYVGYADTPVGILIGAVWGFVDGYVCGALIAFFYNFCVRKCSCRFCHPENVAKKVE